MANRFRSLTRQFEGELTVDRAPAEAFPLFSPEGEREWVPGWDPEPVHPAGAAWEEGQIFRTREDSGDAVWVISRLDREGLAATYHRVEPGHYVARVDVSCAGPARGPATVRVGYRFVGLSEAGNRAIEAMTADDYDAKMARWAEWIRAASR